MVGAPRCFPALLLFLHFYLRLLCLLAWLLLFYAIYGRKVDSPSTSLLFGVEGFAFFRQRCGDVHVWIYVWMLIKRYYDYYLVLTRSSYPVKAEKKSNFFPRFGPRSWILIQWIKSVSSGPLHKTTIFWKFLRFWTKLQSHYYRVNSNLVHR